MLAHLKDVDPPEPTWGRSSSGPAASRSGDTWSSSRRDGPDLPLILEHLPLEHVPVAITRSWIFESDPERRVRASVDQVVGLGRLRERDAVRDERVDLELAAREQRERRARSRGRFQPGSRCGAPQPLMLLTSVSRL